MACAVSTQYYAVLAGESYGGVYVPLLAQAVLDGNDAGALPRLNLKARAAFTQLLPPEGRTAIPDATCYLASTR